MRTRKGSKHVLILLHAQYVNARLKKGLSIKLALKRVTKDGFRLKHFWAFYKTLYGENTMGK